MDEVAYPPSGAGLHTPGELRLRFAAAFQPRSWIYWLDFSASALFGWMLLLTAARVSLGSPLYLLLTAGSSLALLRAALFVHELAHRRRGELPGFEAWWNLWVGIPLQVPSLMYVGSHLEHHRRAAFGTERDPEYAPIARWPRPRIALFVLGVTCLPLVLPLRWGLLGPLSRLIPPLRRVTVARASTLVINGRYRRPQPEGADAARWAAQEASAAAFAWAAAAGLWLGWLPRQLLLQWWLVGSGIWVVNQVRTLAAHGYVHGEHPVDTEGQLLDSINLRGRSWLGALAAPVGLRFHALHHYLPGIPYHSLGRVHRALLRELPQDSPYHRTLSDGLLQTLQNLWGGGARRDALGARASVS